jgi:predicted TIM-barrel fold metal-dependent hydrolase
VLTDDDLPAFFAKLGIPGAIDIHVHFMPDNVLRKVWAYFDAIPGRVWPDESEREERAPASPAAASGAWQIRYRFDEQTRIDTLTALGVLRHTALNYPHKPQMAQWLNDWSLEFAGRAPRGVASGTFFPEPGVVDYVRAALDGGVRVFKSHLQVGAYDPRDPQLDPVWGMLAEAGVPVVCHCGDGPTPGRFTGAGPISEVLARHPRLTLVVAHFGAPGYADFIELVDRYPNLHLDTTMAFTDFGQAPFPPELHARLVDLAPRIVLGSDFPNIPYPYAHQVFALQRLDLGDEWLRAVLHDNGARLLGLGAATQP